MPNEKISIQNQIAGKNYKILVVEDDKFLRNLCIKKLEKGRYEVHSAIDGIEAIKKIESLKPNLILLDILLPGLDGYKILEKIKNHPKREIAQIPIVILSNLGQEIDIIKAKKLGADDYLIKANFTIDEIMEKIKKFVR